MELNDTSIVLATLVPDAQRLDFLPRHFGHQMMTVEQHLYARLSELSEDYSGGFWNFHDLSNGGCYLAPTAPDQFRIVVHGNDFAGTLSADATGITAHCLRSVSWRSSSRELKCSRHDSTSCGTLQRTTPKGG